MLYSDQNERTVTKEVEGGAKVNIKRDPRHGFWTLHFERGGMPRQLKGNFTSLEQAEQKLDSYLATREKNQTKVKRTVTSNKEE